MPGVFPLFSPAEPPPDNVDGQPEFVDQSYYPSWKLRLIMRLDEFGDESKLTPAPNPPLKNRVGVKALDTDLVVTPDPLQRGRFLLLPKDGKLPASNTSKEDKVPNVFANVQGDNDLSFEVVVIPKSVEWNQNGMRTADTLHASLKYIDCPIDPRLVRSCAIELYLGTIPATDFARGVHGDKRTAGYAQDGDGESLSLIPDTYIGQHGEKRSNVRFQGFVDKWTVDWNDSGEPMISIECRDCTQLLIDEEVPSKLLLGVGVPGEKPIDEAIAVYLSHFPQLRGFSVEYRPPGESPPKFDGAFPQTAFIPHLGPSPAKGGGASQKLSVWDYLTDVCGSLGHVIRVDGTNIIVQRVRSFTTNAIVRRPDDPFRGRLLNGQLAAYRRFIFGRNLSEMRVSRHYSGSTPKNIEVRSYDTENKKVIVARFPEPPDRLKWVIPGDTGTSQKWTVIRVSGINDPKHLKVVAQSYYESVGRNEFSIELKTKNLASFGGGNLDPDILDMKAGDTFELLVNKDESEVSTMTRIENLLLSQERNQALMQSLGFSDKFARAIAKAYNDAAFLSNFRVKSMKVSCDTEDGVTLNIQGVNYVEVRADKIATDKEAGSAAEPGSLANVPPQPTPGGGSTPKKSL